MKRTYFALTVLLVVFAIAVLPAVAAADSASAPQLPAQIHGTVVDKNGVPLPAGTVITATVDGNEFTYTIKEDGRIGEPGTFGEKFLVHGENAGSSIEFSVNGEPAGELPLYTPGKSMEFDLSFPVDADDLQSSGSSASGDSPSTPSVPADTPGKNPVETPSASNPSKTPSESTSSPSETPEATDLPVDDDPGEILPPAGDTGDSPVEVVQPIEPIVHPTDVQTPGFSFGLLMGALTLSVFLTRKGGDKQ